MISKKFNRKKVNRPIYKYFYCDNFGHFDALCCDKLRSKGNDIVPLRTTNVLGS